MWQRDLEHLLLNAGVNGLTQTDIVIAFHKRATGVELERHLRALYSEKKVQKFMLASGKRGGRKATLWRATTLLEGG